jgi:hypothetical protein
LWFGIDLFITIGKFNIENNNCGLKRNVMVKDKFDLRICGSDVGSNISS